MDTSTHNTAAIMATPDLLLCADMAAAGLMGAWRSR